MIPYREEVEHALQFDTSGEGCGSTADRLALILLGVKLGLEAAAARAEDLSCGFHSPWEYCADVAAEIRDIHPGYVLQVKP